MRLIYEFDFPHSQPPLELKELLGGKGANLAEMTSKLGLPVPPGFTISAEACQRWMKGEGDDDLLKEIDQAITRLEARSGRRLGDSANPMLLSVRSGAKFSMPGMLDTVLNLGLNDESVLGLASLTNDPRFAFDSYRRFISMFGKIVFGVEATHFDHEFDELKSLSGVGEDYEIDAASLESLSQSFKSIVRRESGQTFPHDPSSQLRLAVEAVFRSWNGPRAIAYRQHEGIPDDLGTAVNVQLMVFGNRDSRSGTGVGFTRNPSTGAREPFGDFLVNAQGEDVVAGIRTTEPLDAMRTRFPDSYRELLRIFGVLEEHYLDMCDTEFTIESGKLWMLQTRTGKRSGRAALKMAVDMTEDLGISRHEAVRRISWTHVGQVLHPQFEPSPHVALATGLGASPGAAVGRCHFSSQSAVKAASRGEKVILVRAETSPEDIDGMLAAEGILTAKGGLVSHAAVVARGWGKPAVVGLESMVLTETTVTLNGSSIREGEWLSIDGSTGEVFADALALIPSTPPQELQTILDWADDIRRGRLGIRANADTAEDAARARSLGAEGIGLCRTEHMFLAEDRLPIVRRLIVANDEESEVVALEEMRHVQRVDFLAILREMDGLPTTIRLLDPPLHEFLPSVESLLVQEAAVGLSDDERALLEASRRLHEVNPMLGARGVRLGVLHPRIYRMQVRAIVEAAVECLEEGRQPIIEIMIPLVVSLEEFQLAKDWVEEVLSEIVSPSLRERLDVKVGTMIETPRAALVADEIAKSADFFSFGTNDLTQMTFGFSRDDVESKMMRVYLEKGLLSHNPFDSIDQGGVGSLVRTGLELGRATNPDLKIGVCGEHGGDPESIAFFFGVGIDYVSCSPFRLPLARLAAAQAVLGESTEGRDTQRRGSRTV